MTDVELVKCLMQDLNSLSLTGVQQWETGVRMATGLITLKKDIEHQMEVSDNEKNSVGE